MASRPAKAIAVSANSRQKDLFSAIEQEAAAVEAIDGPSSATIKQQIATNIEDYDLDQSVLHTELARLLALLELAFRIPDKAEMRSIAHQLVGLAGLYELPEVELTTIELQGILKTDDSRKTWQCLSRLIRIVNNSDSEAE